MSLHYSLHPPATLFLASLSFLPPSHRSLILLQSPLIFSIKSQGKKLNRNRREIVWGKMESPLEMVEGDMMNILMERGETEI